MKYAMLLLISAIFVFAGCGGDEQESGTSGASSKTAGSTGSSGASTSAESTAGGELRTVTISASSGEEAKVRVEIADDIFERARGLMYRTDLGQNRGMLFIYDDETVHKFWMKNTLIPLSVAFMNSNGRIVDIQKMEPVGREQAVPDEKLPRYVSAAPARYALEVNQGFFDERGVEVGDTAELPDV
ncbi:hypothetical protein BH23ACT11_BH23ACT11_12570 [soil metagenome]